MKKKELDEFLSQAIDYAEDNDIDKVIFARWLHKNFCISLGEIQVSMEDGAPYLYAQHIDETADVDKDEKAIIETWIPMKKYEEKIFKKLEQLKEEAKNADVE